MIPEKLKQTDQHLIEILRDRLSILETLESEVDDLEQLSYVAPLLAQAGVPESIWANIVKSCHTAVSRVVPTSITDNLAPQKITIIGGRGRMGRFFTSQLTAVGHKVSVLENEDWARADELLGSADLVIIGVPIEWTTEVIKRAAKYLAPTAALCDITSLKTEPVQAMLEHHCGPVMGLHPMFGPNVKSFAGQKVVACPGRSEKSFQWLLNFIQTKGGEVIFCTPEEHDHMMVIIQATRHFSRFSVGVFLSQEEIDIERSLSMSSPSYRQEIDIIKRLFSQSPNLCADIMLATSDRCQAITRLAETYDRVANLVVRKDRAALIKEFEAAQSFFNESSAVGGSPDVGDWRTQEGEDTNSPNQSNSYKKRRENSSFLKGESTVNTQQLTVNS